MNNAIDEVRRHESKDNPVLKRFRYVWLNNPGNLTAEQTGKLESLSNLHLKTGRAYRICLAFQDFFLERDRQNAELYLKSWYL